MTALLDRAVDASVLSDVTRREFLAGAVALGLLAGCGDASRPPDAAASSSGFPVTVGHVGGELTIDARPSRIVTVSSFSELDVLLALGVVPVARGHDGERTRSWQLPYGVEDIPKIGGALGNLEAVAAQTPDLIIMNGDSYVQFPAEVAAYQRICPVLGLWPDGLERQLRLAATATGASLDDLGTTLKRVDAIIDGFVPARRPTSVVSAHPQEDGQVYVWAAGSPGSTMMELLGLPALSSPPPDADGLGAYVSPERLDLLESDLLLISSSTSDDPGVATLRANPIFARLDVVADGRTTVLTEEETTAVHDVTVLSLPVAVAALNRALA